MFNKQEDKTMKKLILMFAVFAFAFIFKASGEMNYVSIEGKTYFSDEVKVGLNSLRITTDEGLTLKAPLKKVDAYMVNGKLFERLPLICKTGKTRGTALMEFVSQRNGLRLYKYCAKCEDDALGCRFFDESQNETIYLVYKDGELYLRIDKINGPTVFPFFRVDYREGVRS
jgi:hypothetical protein